MKYIVGLLRVLVGLLFIFSGLIKSNDPTGFSYKLEEYFEVFATDLSVEQEQLAVLTSTQDGEQADTFEIIPEVGNPQIIVSCSDWQSINMNDGTEMEPEYVHLAHAKITMSGKVLFEQDLSTMDSNAVVQEVSIKATVAGNQILDQTISFKSFSNNEDIHTIDIEPYVKSENALVGVMHWFGSYSLFLAIFICVFEIVLGIALLIGWAPKLTIWLLLLMIIFFTFLTGYSVIYDAVKDCGCFGDAIKLTPLQSFYKDLILSAAILIIFIGRKHVKPIFSKAFGIRVISISVVIVTGFSLYCWYYLPVKNFLHFKPGNDILEKSTLGPDAKQEIREYVFIYENEVGDRLELTTNQVNSEQLKKDGYKYVDRVDKIIQEGDEAPIHDFVIIDKDGNSVLDSFYNGDVWKMMIVINDVDKANLKSMPKLKELIKAWSAAGHAIYPLTGSTQEQVEQFRHDHQLAVDFYSGDKTNLKSIIRSNPGVLIIKESTVIENWPSTRLPDAEELMEYTQ